MSPMIASPAPKAALFPDVELWLTGWLHAKLASRTEPCTAGVVVANKVPTVRPARLVTTRRDGGPKVNPLQEVARIGFNVWAPTEQEATDLSRLVRAIVSAAAGQGPVRKVTETSGPSPIADVVPRRYFTCEMRIHGSIITV